MGGSFLYSESSRAPAGSVKSFLYKNLIEEAYKNAEGDTS